jgi:peptide/histidine transporter 3/4
MSSPGLYSMSSDDGVGGVGGRAEPATARSVLRSTIPFLLWNEFGERLAFYGLVTNLIIYLSSVMGQTAADAAVSVNIFQGTCYLTPLLGAYLADTVYGRYKTILIFSWIYFAGLVLLTASAVSSTKSMAALYVALFTIALGTGGIKANNSTFGADQFDDENPRDQLEKRSFFNWFYFSINVGSLIASTVIVYVQENISWAIGFAVPAAAMLGAIVVLMAGQSRYKHVQPSDSPLERIVHVTKAALRGRRRAREREVRRDNHDWKRHDRDQGGRSNAGASAEAGSHLSTDIDTESEPLVPGAQDSSLGSHWLDAAVGQHTAQEVDEVKLVYALFPVFFTTILFWTVYTQMQTFFVVQGSMMYRRIGSFVVPAASLSMMDTLAIVGLIPVYEKLFAPMLTRMGYPVTTLKRIGWGLVICSTSMIAAAAVERRRLGAVRDAEPPPSIWLQVPMYVLVGAAEIGTSVGTMEFFYDNAPAAMRSSASALQLLSVCIGSYLSSFLVIIVQSLSTLGGGAGWLPDDLNAGRLDAFFLLLAALMALNALLFVWVCRRYYSYS